MNKKNIYTVITVLLIGAFLSYNYYQKIFGNAITKNTVLFVHTTDSLISVKKKIEVFSSKPQTFLWVAAKKNFSKLKHGRYLLKKGMSNNDLVNMLRNGEQTPLKISFNNQDSLEKLAGRISSQIETDSISLLNSFKDETFLKANNFNKKTVLGMFIPNSYEVYWSVSADKFRNRMLLEYNLFWNNSRLEKAKKINLSKEEVITLASIIQKETAKDIERPIIAGLYLNRLKKGWPLQADPTIIYCIRENKTQNHIIKRVLTVDLAIKSPYNTYKNKGLPPSLISMPDISAIDAVLNAGKHNYYFMCASIDRIGYHIFSRKLSEHNRNASKYRRWLNTKKIHR